MARPPKFLLDNDLDVTLYGQLQQRNHRVAWSRDEMQQAARATDLEILAWAAPRNFHVITMDQGFLNAITHPCDPSRYARRTVLNLPAYELHRADRFLSNAWRHVTWAKLRTHDAIQIQRDRVIAYRCDGRAYVAVEEWNTTVSES